MDAAVLMEHKSDCFELVEEKKGSKKGLGRRVGTDGWFALYLAVYGQNVLQNNGKPFRTIRRYPITADDAFLGFYTGSFDKKDTDKNDSTIGSFLGRVTKDENGKLTFKEVNPEDLTDIYRDNMLGATRDKSQRAHAVSGQITIDMLG